MWKNVLAGVSVLALVMVAFAGAVFAQAEGTDPLNPDTDQDKLNDWEELTLTYPTTFTSPDHPPVKDYQTSYSFINNLRCYGKVEHAYLEIGIKHTYRRDLQIYIGYWAGSRWDERTIFDRSYNSGEDLYITKDLLHNDPAIPDTLSPTGFGSAVFETEHTWRLKVHDAAKYDEGRIDYFWIKIKGKTNPLNPNTDFDFWDDREEVLMGFSPIRPNVLGGAISVHPDEIDTSEELTKTLDRIVDLGATFVRIDFAWTWIEPKNDQWEKLDVFQNLLRECKKRGLRVIAILGTGGMGGTGMPQWAKDLYCQWGMYDYTRIAPEWKEYCKKIALEFGEDIYFYQILNEENHIIQGQFPTEHEPYAFRDAYLSIETKDNHFETIANIYAGWPGWVDHMENWMKTFSKDYIDILAIDHYPGTWTATGFDDWAPLDSLIDICNEYGKKGAIMETGFSTWGGEDAWWGTPGYTHTEDEQEIFITTASPIIREKVLLQNTKNPKNKIVIATWYELRDYKEAHNMLAPIFIEDNFGILRNDWRFKMGYDDLQRQMMTFTEL